MAIIERSDPDHYPNKMPSPPKPLLRHLAVNAGRNSIQGGVAAGGVAGVMPLAQLPHTGGAILNSEPLLPGASLTGGLNGTVLPPATIPGISGSNCTASLRGAALSLPTLGACP